MDAAQEIYFYLLHEAYLDTSTTIAERMPVFGF